MEPTADELNQIGDLKGAYDWAGVPDDMRDALGQALGDPTKIRDIIFVTRTPWDTTVGRIKGSTTPDADGNRAPRDLTPAYPRRKAGGSQSVLEETPEVGGICVWTGATTNHSAFELLSFLTFLTTGVFPLCS